MPTILMDTQGRMVDLDTGNVVGRAEGMPTAVDPLKANTTAERPTEGNDTLLGVLKQASWAWNAGIFALPDLAQRKIGQALGLDEDQVFQFTRFFNRGEVAPRSSLERFIRAAMTGASSGLPFTGILGAAAAARPAIQAAMPAKTLFQGITKDAMDMIAKNPKQALAMDIAFGAGFDTLRQAVEENVSDDYQTLKPLLKELLPTAAFLGAPAAVDKTLRLGSRLYGMTPSGMAINKVKEQMLSSDSLSGMDKDILAQMPGYWKLPLVKVVPEMLLSNAEKRLAQSLGPFVNSPESQAALKRLEDIMADPRFADVFQLDLTERTMYGPAIAQKTSILEQMGPKELESFKQRNNSNVLALNKLMTDIAPSARKPIMDAFLETQAQRQAYFDSLVQQNKDMTAAEIAAISERLGPQNMDMLNNEVRGVIEARMEADNKMRQNVLSRMGLKQATAPDGTPLPTRDKGQSLYEARDMEEAVLALINKYKPERPSMATSVPQPIRLLDDFVQRQLSSRASLERQALNQLADDLVDTQLSQLNRTGMDPEYIKIIKNSVRELVGIPVEKLAKGKSGKGRIGIRDLASVAPGAKVEADGTVSVFSGSPGSPIRVNVQQIREDAARIAGERTRVDLNMPEAIDYLMSAQRFRTDSLNQYNAAMMGKNRIRQTDAQRLIDTGNAVFNDVEKLVLNHAPRLKGEYNGLKTMVDDYKQVYDSYFPLLVTQKKRGGMEYYLPNEDLMHNAFKSAENLRSLTAILGPDQQSSDLLMKGVIDWLRSKNVVNKDGLVDPKTFRSVLNKNRNIVDALPANIQAKLNDEMALADDYVKRLGELDRRMVLAQDNELNRLLSKVTRPDADPRQGLVDALDDPAVMRKLVNTMSADPEMLAALRRSIYDIAGEGVQGGAPLSDFLRKNERSLKVLYDGTNHYLDLLKLADMQQRVTAYSKVAGRMPAFESFDEGLKRAFGFGLQFGTTTAREALTQRIAPASGAMMLMVRMTGSLENELYKRVFTRAMEDEGFARALIAGAGTPKGNKEIAKQLEKVGVTPQMLFPSGGYQYAAQKASEGAQKDRNLPIGGMSDLPVVPRETASQMLRQLPPAPPTRGTNFNPRMPTTPQVQQGSGIRQVPLMYPAMFPNDPISGLLQQRQAMIQGPRQ